MKIVYKRKANPPIVIVDGVVYDLAAYESDKHKGLSVSKRILKWVSDKLIALGTFIRKKYLGSL
jgi:hypothetical protein